MRTTPISSLLLTLRTISSLDLLIKVIRLEDSKLPTCSESLSQSALKSSMSQLIYRKT